MKPCIICHIEKELSEFYPHPGMSDGHLNKCKDCTKLHSKQRAEKMKLNDDWIEQERTRGRRKYHRLYKGTQKARPLANKKWVQKYPEKKAATSMSAHLAKPFYNAERHHWSYNAEHFKDVIWLTKQEHCKAHRFITYDQSFKMYRRYDTNELLDTKEKHEAFITDCIRTKAA